MDQPLGSSAVLEPTPSPPQGARRLAILVFAVSFLVFGLSPNVTNGDSYLSFPTAVSLVHDGDLGLDEFESPEVREHYGLIEAKSEHVDFYPWVVALLFVPVVIVVDAGHTVGLGDGAIAAVESDSMGLFQLVVASAITAAAAGLVTSLAWRRSRLEDRRRRRWVALAVGFAFAFGTASWSTASRALWQHGPSMLLIAAALLVAERASRRPSTRSALALGAIVACAFAVRPTNAIVVLAVGAWCLVRGRRTVLGFVFGGLAVAAPWAIVNQLTFGQLLPPYHEGGRLAAHDEYVEALLANLVSPARGLLVFAPITLAAGVGAFLAWRRGRFDHLDAVCVAIVVGYWLVVSAGAEAWWAGHAIGARFLTDPLPALALLAVPAVDWLIDRPVHETGVMRLRWPIVALAGAALLWSVAVNGGAAVVKATNCWNIEPTDINQDHDRVWSWSDPQVLAGFGYVLEDGVSSALRADCVRT